MTAPPAATVRVGAGYRPIASRRRRPRTSATISSSIILSLAAGAALGGADALAFSAPKRIATIRAETYSPARPYAPYDSVGARFEFGAAAASRWPSAAAAAVAGRRRPRRASSSPLFSSADPRDNSEDDDGGGGGKRQRQQNPEEDRARKPRTSPPPPPGGGRGPGRGGGGPVGGGADVAKRGRPNKRNMRRRNRPASSFSSGGSSSSSSSPSGAPPKIPEETPRSSSLLPPPPPSLDYDETDDDDNGLDGMGQKWLGRGERRGEPGPVPNEGGSVFLPRQQQTEPGIRTNSSLLPPPLPPPSDDGGEGASRGAGAGGRIARRNSSWADAAMSSDAGWGDWFSDDKVFGESSILPPPSRQRRRGGGIVGGGGGNGNGGDGNGGDKTQGVGRGAVRPPLDPSLPEPLSLENPKVVEQRGAPPSSRGRTPSIGDIFSSAGRPSSSSSSDGGGGAGRGKGSSPPHPLSSGSPSSSRQGRQPSGSTPSPADVSATPPPGLDGVLPVSELFYRSTASISADDDVDGSGSEGMGDDDEAEEAATGGGDARGRQNIHKRRGESDRKEKRAHGLPSHADEDEGDDEELPFSAEQSDRLMTGGHVRVRRNQVGARSQPSSMSSSGDDGDEAEAEAGNAKSRRESRRRNQRKEKRLAAAGAGRKSAKGGGGNKKKGRRRMVRRGMEMLVGGEPINADPPMRFIELAYDYDAAAVGAAAAGVVSASAPLEGGEGTEPSMLDLVPYDWAAVATVNSRDFGPLLHGPSVGSVSHLSRGLYCEHFVDAAIRWNVCPKDLKEIVREQELAQQYERDQDRQKLEENGTNNADPYLKLLDEVNRVTSSTSAVSMDIPIAEEEGTKTGEPNTGISGTSPFASNILSTEKVPVMLRRDDSDAWPNGDNFLEGFAGGDDEEVGTLRGSGKGFGFAAKFGKNKKDGKGNMSPPSSFQTVQSLGDSSVTMNRAMRRKKDHPSGHLEDSAVADVQYTLGGELKFTLGVTRTELESGRDGGRGGNILRRVLDRGITGAIDAGELGYDVTIAKLVLKEIDGGATDISVEFQLTASAASEARDYTLMQRAAKQINAGLAQAMDDGDMALAMAASAREEKAWPARVRDRIVEEFLFENEGGMDEEDEDVEGDNEEGKLGTPASDEGAVGPSLTKVSVTSSQEEEAKDEYDGPFGMPGDILYPKDDLYLGGGNSGLFYDYSETSISTSPYNGRLGPLLVDAVAERALQRQPRVIAIGDVHGCIDELQMLLRKCEYRPGDVVVFLGDLVSKGPDSLSVVQMAREMGAIGVRGNHDFEVIRWHQAIKSGADPPVIGSEHFHIASGLSKADLRWMYSLPWYISSKELGALFVHAGFVSGIRLAKQNPRLMMNMRYVLRLMRFGRQFSCLQIVVGDDCS